MSNTQNTQTEKFETWAIVELFGHTQIAGLVTEATIGGCSFLRVDVPAVNGRPAFTKFYGNGAMYSLTPVGEQEARMALQRIMPRPVSTFLLPEAKPRGEGNVPAGTIEEGAELDYEMDEHGDGDYIEENEEDDEDDEEFDYEADLIKEGGIERASQE
ncbi:MAG: hypothetical protein IT323_13640 [Anaerolineae bacterium]|nr:hypothetical protein [Anaerolineae bacterium]